MYPILFAYRKGVCQPPFVANGMVRPDGKGPADAKFMVGNSYGNPWTFICKLRIMAKH